MAAAGRPSVDDHGAVINLGERESKKVGSGTSVKLKPSAVSVREVEVEADVEAEAEAKIAVVVSCLVVVEVIHAHALTAHKIAIPIEPRIMARPLSNSLDNRLHQSKRNSQTPARKLPSIQQLDGPKTKRLPTLL